MVDLLDLVPVESCGIADLSEVRTSRALAARHDVKPVAVATVFSGALLIGSEAYDAIFAADSLHLDQPKLA